MSISMMWGKELRKAVKQAEPSILEDLIRFLEDDPRTIGAGYRKEIIWKYIKRYSLTPDEIIRLEQVALQYLYRAMTREFKLMCQTMSRIATDNFWNTVHSKLNSDVPRVQINAYCLYAYSKGVYAGEKQRLELKNTKRYILRQSRAFYYDHNVYDVDDLLAMLKQPENWPGGEIIYCEPDPTHLPVLYYDPSHDLEFATFYVAKGNKEQILRKLYMVLAKGEMNGFTSSAWHYAIYLLYQINDVRAVPILIKFLQDKISYKFDGVTKSMFKTTSLKVLRHYGTPEALSTLKEYSADDSFYSQYYRESSHGWILSYPTEEI